MVWSENLIKNKIRDEELIITSPTNNVINVNDLSFGNRTSLELHLSRDLYKWDFDTSFGQEPAPIDSTSDGYSFNEFFQKNTKKIDLVNGRYILEHNELILWKTYESIKMPCSAFARVETKSKIARLGISCHNTAPAIQRDFNDRIMLEITNTSKIPVVLRPYLSCEEEGTKIAQLFFEDVTGENCIQKRITNAFFYNSTPNKKIVNSVRMIAYSFLLGTAVTYAMNHYFIEEPIASQIEIKELIINENAVSKLQKTHNPSS